MKEVSVMSDISAEIAGLLSSYEEMKKGAGEQLHLDISFWMPIMSKNKVSPIAAIYFNGKHDSLSQDDYEKIKKAIEEAVPHLVD
jgi:hypothetical protein